MISNKKISNILEKSLASILNMNYNNTKGIDLFNKNYFIEVKSSYRYSNYSCNYRNQDIRFSHYSFKPNEISKNIDYYIFIEKVNKINDLFYIKKLNIYVVKITDLLKFFKKENKNISKRLQISVNKIRKIPYISLNKLMELL